jgi:transposase
MCLHPQAIPPVPEATAQVAQAAFPKGNIYMQMRDELGSIYTDDLFADLYPADGQPTISPWRLALVTVMQFAENLSDRQASEAVRSRIDWKYALSLDLTDAGFDYSVLSEFRTRLVAGDAGERLLDALLTRLRQGGWLKARGQQRTDSTAVLAAVRELNQLEIVGETLRHALNSLATVAPDWLRHQVRPEWYERYSERFDEFRLPKEKAARQQLVETIGHDGYHMLERIYSAEALPWLRQMPAVETLRQVWLQQYWLDEGQVKRRQPREMPPVSQWLRSPYDTEVRYGSKGDRTWIGYKVHFTETCGNDCPHVITQVETVPATQQDHHALTPIQAGLAEKQLLPAQQLVDAGYISAKRIIESQANHGIDLLGPVHRDPSWQARTAGAFDVSCFEVAWEQKSVTCPQGQQSVAWHLSKDAKGESVVQILFDKATCQACAVRSHCTRGQRSGRSLTLRYPAERHEMLQIARTRQATEAFRTAYRKRAGIEGTFSQALRIADLRHTRYIGIQKTHLQHLATAAATNILRVINWLNELPLAPTRTSRFAALAAT